MQKIKVAILGSAGRMGKMLVAEMPAFADMELVAAVARDGSAEAAIKLCDVAVDFTNGEACLTHAAMAASAKKPFVCGVTGLNDAQMQKLRDAARTAPIFHAPNMSLGVFLLNRLVEAAAKQLPAEYQIEISEIHHAQKLDSPSGTALHLAKTAAFARGLSEKDFCFGRSGHSGARPQNQIGIHALRQGDVVGEHTVSFAGPMERIELTHKAHNRAVFARGALTAARWLTRQKPGFYGMADLAG